MKLLIHFTNVLFRARGKIIITLLLFSAIAIAQELPPQEFIFGGTWNWNERHNEPFYDTFKQSGMNYLTQYADDSSHGLLQGLNFSAYNSMYPYEWIYYYSTAYYSKWEAEENQQDTLKVGFKHIDKWGNTIGSPATFLGRQCWSTEGLSESHDSLIYGPHYHQEKVYKRWYSGQPDSLRWNVRYTPRFSMALHLNDENIDPEEVVCKLYVRESYRYQIDGQVVCCTIHWPLKEITLKVSDFAPYDTFKVFYLHTNPDSVWYKYPEEFQDPHDGSNKRENLQTQDILYFDRWGGQGVQFCVDWLRNDTKCNLYIDYVEVYDNDGGQDFADDPERVDSLVRTYAQQFPQSEWSNMKYWGGPDEPSSIDDYVPMKTVDAILESIDAPRLISTFYPWWEVEVNGDTQLVRYYNTVHPKKLMIDFFPFLDFRVPASFADFDNTREMFQICHTLDPDFYYQAAAFGYKVGGEWSVWRYPDTSEYKAQIMLALAHGVGGIVNYTFTSLHDPGPNGNGTYGIINPDGTPYTEHNLYSVIKDNLVPRLKGTLGNTLMHLDYTGDYVDIYYKIPSDDPLPQPLTHEYLTVGCGGLPADDMYWHFGFFNRPYYPEDKYFFTTNLMQWIDSSQVVVCVTPPSQGYSNYRFRNIEGYFDTTFTTSLAYILKLKKGEGYLYEVAPVVKFGGKLIHPETISNETTLIDEMVIQNGATLTVNSTYNVDRDIRIKAGGSIITTNGGTLKFYAGSKLIIEGIAALSGTASHKLILDFLSPGNSNGIIIKRGGSLTIYYCEIRNASNGIFSELNANYLNAQNVDFNNCQDYSISILGRSAGENPTPPSQIKYCTITNSDYGIHISNLSEIIIQENIINNTDLGIYLSSVSSASVINNQINSNRENMSAIFCNSTNGSVRGNNISGHTTGIYFANASSMDVGGNIITDCLYHGMFVGDGSVLNMVGRLVQAQGHHYYYATSGYNKIYENGGYEGFGLDNDGSEIFFSGRKSNAILNRGCNSTFDDREPSPPLVNTELLMNSDPAITVSARHNYWGEKEVNEHRFGNMTVDFGDALSDSCHLPDGSGSPDGLIVKSSFGDVIDTVYSTGEEGENLTETEIAYSEAEEKFLSGDMTSALQLYDDIIASGATDEEKYFAYERKYEIGRMTGQSPEYFNELGAAFTTLASNAQDSVNQKILNQHSILCKVGEQEYEESIGEFDAIIQQNPNTEEAVYAEIDAITTAILIEEADSTLHKGKLGKYLVKPGENYFTKLDGILRKHFGNGKKESEAETLPTEYTLYQNYPNPFNPITTIKYDLPNASDVSLIIYDILGRKVKELVNTKQQAGRYEIQFNASSLASGVYIYQLIAEKYINAKKMILLK